MRRIAPNRFDPLVDETGRPSLRFSDVIEDLVSNVNDLLEPSVNTQDSDYTLVLEDAGKVLQKTSSTNFQDYIIPANSSVAFPIITRIEVHNDGSSDMDIDIDDDELVSEAGLGSGKRTIAPDGSAIITKVATTKWKIRGEQLT